MKAQISRESHRSSQRYSGVYHIQGAMVTDADLDERSVITRERTDNFGNDTVRDGVPETGGAVAGIADGKPVLREGIIYADGVRGELVAAAGFNPEKSLDLFDKQIDLPLGPALPGGELVIYADIWERPVFPLEDPYLADAGLHGAVTAFRSRTMTQIKAALAAAEPAIESGTGAFPQIGSAKLSVTPLNAQILPDECDPCADVVGAEQTVANALWRLEVVAITGTPDKPGKVHFAWSDENAAEIAPAGISSEIFERTGKVYEFFSPITESHAGVFANADDALRSAFVDDMSATPSPAKNHDGTDWPFVRRWDGYAVIDFATGNVTETLGDGFSIEVSASTFKLQVSAFIAELDIDTASVVRGDYWLVEMRRHAPEAERIRLVQATPVGVLHHYCTLFTVKNGDIQALSDTRRRKLTFPTLSDLPASNVGFDNNCLKLYGDAENVQEALDNLCSISADDIGFTSKCSDVFGNAKTVQEAFDALCDRPDFDIRHALRLLFDWGVVCGILPRLVKRGLGQVAITAGSYLDRSGRLTSFKGLDIDLSKLKFGREILFDNEGTFHKALVAGHVCLVLFATEDGDTKVHLVPEGKAYGPDDPGFAERVKACAEKKSFVNVDGIVGKLTDRQKAAATKMFLASSGGGAFKSTAKLTRAEFAESEAVNKALTEAFAKLAEPEETESLQQRIAKARSDFPIDNVSGGALEIRQMQQATAILAAISETDQERLQRCICQHFFPPCPPGLGDPPYYVPIACLKGSYDPPGIFLQEVCAYCCRKQAMTWRTVEYFAGDMRQRLMARLADVCCKPEKTPSRPDVKLDERWFTAFDAGRLVTDFKLDKAFFDMSEKLPSDFVTTVNVNDLSARDAAAALKGTGVAVEETVDINDAKAFDVIGSKLAGVSPRDVLESANKVRPGDKVVLLVQDGVARGYVLVEKGAGKLPFETVAATAAGGAAVSESDKKLADELIRNVADARSGLNELDQTRTSLVKDIGMLKAEIGSLTKERDAAAESLGKINSQMTDLAKAREKLSGSVDTVARELQAAEKSRDAAIAAVRDGLPMTAVIGNKNPELIAKLAGEGIVTAGDISRLTSTAIKRLDRAGILKETEATELKAKAGDLVKGRT